MARLPKPGGDSGTWGDVLNDYLSQSHTLDGKLKDHIVTPDALAPNSVTNSAIANDAVNAASIADGSITETLLDGDVKTKLNLASPTWSTIAAKPAVVASGDTAMEARGVINAASLPAVYLDPRGVPNGPIAALTKGTFESSFGNSPLAISDGKIVHAPGNGITVNVAGYLQANVGTPITRIGALVRWPAGAQGGVCLAVPAEKWGDAPIGIKDANVHMVVVGNGSISAGRFHSLSGTVIDPYYSRSQDLTGGTHTIEVLLNHAEQRFQILVDGRRYINYVDADYFTNISNYAVWELYETSSSVTPAQFLAVWADSNQSIIPPSLSSEAMAVATPGVEADAVRYLGTNTFTTPTPGTYGSLTSANYAPAFNLNWPESKRILVRVTAYVAVTGGDLYMRINSAFAQLVAKSGFVGRVTYETQISAGDLGTGSNGLATALSVEAMNTAGSSTFTSGGSIGGGMTISAIPLR